MEKLFLIEEKFCYLASLLKAEFETIFFKSLKRTNAQLKECQNSLAPSAFLFWDAPDNESSKRKVTPSIFKVYIRAFNDTDIQCFEL